MHSVSLSHGGFEFLPVSASEGWDSKCVPPYLALHFFILLLIALLNLDYVPLFLCGCLKNNRHLFLPTLWIINSLLLYMQYRKFLTVKFISHLVVCATVVQHLCIPMLHILQNAITTCLYSSTYLPFSVLSKKLLSSIASIFVHPLVLSWSVLSRSGQLRTRIFTFWLFESSFLKHTLDIVIYGDSFFPPI